MGEEYNPKSLVDMSKAVEVLLAGMGEEPGRNGLKDTPARVAKMFLELTAGLRTPCPEITTFPRGSNDQMITLLDLDMASLCEHHCVPFYGKVHIGYIPGDVIAGLSKFGRVVDWVARRPQLQEAMTGQIAEVLMNVLRPVGLIVVIEARHLCMAIRGIRKANHVTVTSAIRGEIDKREFFDLLKIQRTLGGT
jgi:GTP cyclohydrolase IA